MTGMGRDLGIALSLANLCYLRVWSEILTYQEADAFFMKAPPSPVHFAAALLNVVTMAGLLWLAMTAARREPSGRTMELARWAFCVFLLVGLNAVRSVVFNGLFTRWPSLSPVADLRLMWHTPGRFFLLLLLLSSVGALVRWNGRLVRAGSGVLFVLLPALPVTFGQAVWKSASYDPAPFLDKPLAAPRPAQSHPAARVLWIVFDEWDQRLTFLDRRSGTSLPSVYRFRDQAVYATNAYPPGPSTLLSMTSLITGRLVVRAEAQGPGNLLLAFADSRQTVPWDSQPNVFSKARAAGFNTAVVGWYIPYGRLLNSDLTFCRWWEMARQHNSVGQRLPETLFHQARSLLETNSRSIFGQSLATIKHRQTCQAILEQAKQVAADPKLGLILVHFPLPHEPYLSDPSRCCFGLRNPPVEGYFDNLDLLDRTLAELQRSMELAGTWENTNVLLTSDHWYRRARALDGKIDHRVPFLLKLAGQNQRLTYDLPFNTILTGELIASLLEGNLASPQAAAAWLDGQARATPPLEGAEQADGSEGVRLEVKCR